MLCFVLVCFHSSLFKFVGKYSVDSERRRVFSSILPQQDQRIQKDTNSDVPNPAKTKVLSAPNLLASSKLSKLKDLIKMHRCSFPVHAEEGKGLQLDVTAGQVPVAQLWEVNADRIVELLLHRGSSYRVVPN